MLAIATPINYIVVEYRILVYNTYISHYNISIMFEKITVPIKKLIHHLINFSDKAWHKSLFNYVSSLSVFLIIIGYSGIIFIQDCPSHN